MSELNIMENFKSKLEEYANDFKRHLPIKHLPSGIATSEGFSFCAMVDYFEIDCVIESGVCNGGSTGIFATCFDPSVEIIAIDMKLKKEVEERLSPRVSFLSGDGVKLIPKLVEERADKKIAIMLDGPKGNVAVDLAEQLLAKDNVLFVGIDDVFRNVKYHCKQMQTGEIPFVRDRMENMNNCLFFTDEDWFVNQYGWIDEGSGITSQVETIGSHYYTIGYLLNKKLI